MNYTSILDFWFSELTPKDWFQVSTELDQKIKFQFEETLLMAKDNQLVDWRIFPEGRLAEIIVLDQFSRNIYRGQVKAFAQDELAIKLVKEAIVFGIDKKIDIKRRSFLYMPLMHSEKLLDHELAMRVFDQDGLEKSFDFEKKHKVIIDKFGRYPHRNKILGRKSTLDEIEFLNGPGSSF